MHSNVEVGICGPVAIYGPTAGKRAGLDIFCPSFSKLILKHSTYWCFKIYTMINKRGLVLHLSHLSHNHCVRGANSNRAIFHFH